MPCHIAIALCATLVLASPAMAATVHTWVDAEGVRHYADSPPGNAASAEHFEIPELPQSDPAADYYSIANQWSRIRDERESQAERALARARLRHEQAVSEQVPVPEETIQRRNVFSPFAWGTVGYPYRPIGRDRGRFRDGPRHGGGGGGEPAQPTVSAPKGMRTLPDPVYQPEH